MKTLLIIIVAVVVLGGGFYYYKLGSEAPAIVPGDQMGGQVENQPVETPVNIPTSVKEFTVEGLKFSFTPDLVTVKKGDTVRITFKNLDGFHDLVIDEFNVRTKQIPIGEETIEFVADKAGSFEFYCSVGNHRAMGMKGTLVVQ